MSNNSVPGLTPITVQSLPPGSSTPGQAAIASMNESNQKLQNINSIGGRRKYRGGANDQTNGQINVPQHQLLYKPAGGPGTDPNSQTTSLAQTGSQSTEWAKNDNQAAKMGGSKKRRKGGNADWSWGCHSGGRSKRRRTRKTRKTRKNKSRRHYRR
jgi:hypothetical protein